MSDFYLNNLQNEVLEAAFWKYDHEIKSNKSYSERDLFKRIIANIITEERNKLQKFLHGNK